MNDTTMEELRKIAREVEVDLLMEKIHPEWRYRWCGGESGPCACLGCVQIGNREIMFKIVAGESFRGDPEYIDEAKIPANIHSRCKITKEEWLSWCARYPQE